MYNAYCASLFLPEIMKSPIAIFQSLGYAISVFIFPGASLANPYIKTFYQSMGVASTGEQVELLEVKVILRGGYGTKVIYRIGRDIVEGWIYCPSGGFDGNQPYFYDQGKRYAQSNATRKVLSLACQYQRKILTSSNVPSASP